ncbi:MAG: UDP-N-acetylglucosamine--N-acetylmuramyl-(pentapeptide) pyrophosphoryl-undecaprenol N-acetylglucosamine transferase [Acidimicrobiales bacterium]
MNRRRYAVVAGGGTGGHVFEALAVARALCAAGHEPSEIEIMGSRRGQEATLLATAGFPLTLLPGRGIVRRTGPRDLLDNVGAVAGTAWATVRAWARVARWRPRVVVSVGGYASFPAAAAAVGWRVPLVLVNIDAVPGLVHRVLGRFAAASAVAFPGTPLPRSVVTGTPVRDEVVAIRRSPDSARRARAMLAIPPDRVPGAVFGGSLGARTINDAVTTLARRWAGRGDRTLYHVVGRRSWDPALQVTGAADPAPDGLCYRAVPFEDRMELLYQAADVMVCRAGAVTVAELAVVGIPSILVPLPGAPSDHQTANARLLASAGAAVLLSDAECVGSRLESELDDLLGDGRRLVSMGRAARGLGRPDAAARVAEVVVRHAR